MSIHCVIWVIITYTTIRCNMGNHITYITILCITHITKPCNTSNHCAIWVIITYITTLYNMSNHNIYYYTITSMKTCRTHAASLNLHASNTLQHPATHCDILQYTVPQCNTLQHTANLHDSNTSYSRTYVLRNMSNYNMYYYGLCNLA